MVFFTGGEVQSSEAECYVVFERAFPAGTSNPTTALVERTEGGPVRRSEVDAVRRRLESVPVVANVSPVIDRSRDGRIARLNLVFRHDPYTRGVLESVPKIRDRVKSVAPRVSVLLGSGTAVQYDFDKATTRDTRKIVPLALLVQARDERTERAGVAAAGEEQLVAE